MVSAGYFLQQAQPQLQPHPLQGTPVPQAGQVHFSQHFLVAVAVMVNLLLPRVYTL